jgi:hypothetical protein
MFFGGREMIPVPSWLEHLVATLLVVLLIVLFYEGVPVIKEIPLIGHVPVVGWVVEGEVDRREATALDGYVAKEALDTLQQKIAETDRQKQAATAALDQANKQIATAKAAEAQANADLEKGISDYEKRLVDARRSCLLDDDDVSVIVHNGAGAVAPVGHR